MTDLRRMLAATAATILLTGAAAGCEKDTAGGRSAGGEVTYPTSTVQLMVPAAPGGGWDLTARAMQKALEDGKLGQGERRGLQRDRRRPARSAWPSL